MSECYVHKGRLRRSTVTNILKATISNVFVWVFWYVILVLKITPRYCMCFKRMLLCISVREDPAIPYSQVQALDVHVTMHRVKFLVIKPTRCTNFSNLFLEWNSTRFGQFLCPPSGVFHCTHSNGICRTRLLTACKQDRDGTSWSCLRAVSKPADNCNTASCQWSHGVSCG